jgi:hypothetical protein
MTQPNAPQGEQSKSPRFCKSDELFGKQVEILWIDETESDFGPEYLYDLRLSSGEVVSFTRHRDPWRTLGVTAMRAALDNGEPVTATLMKPNRAVFWKPWDMRGSRVSAGRAARLRELGFNLNADSETGEPQRRSDDVPPPSDEDAPIDDLAS